MISRDLERTGRKTNIQASSSNVGTDQSSLASIAELEECIGSLLLLLLAVQLQDRQIDVVQQLSVVFDTVTRRKEHNDFLLLVPFQKGEPRQ